MKWKFFIIFAGCYIVLFQKTIAVHEGMLFNFTILSLSFFLSS